MSNNYTSENLVHSAAPIFVLGFHRGGTTFVQRLLNCHRRVVIWGEHAGIVKELRGIYENYKKSPAMEVDFLSYSDFSGFAERFIPWANPFGHEALRARLANFLESLYKPSGEYDGVWGFKEIRYGCSEDIKFLIDLFPNCRMLFVIRHPRALLLSRYFAKWGRNHFSQPARVEVQQMLAGYIRALDAFLETAENHPNDTVVLQYETLCKGQGIDEIFKRMKLNEDEIDQKMLRCVFRARAGSSFGGVSLSTNMEYEQELFSVFDEHVGRTFAELASERVVQFVKARYPDVMQ